MKNNFLDKSPFLWYNSYKKGDFIMYEVFTSQSTDFVDNIINTTYTTTTNNSTRVGTARVYQPQVGDVFTIREEQV